MGDPSFKAINYSLRPKKNVERKLIGELLGAMEDSFSISNYRYIGFGSMWFTDFVLFHRLLNIHDMISIEKEKSSAERASFNAPYSCIKVKIGEASKVLPELQWDDKPAIVWLDYDKQLDSGYFDDLDILGKYTSYSGSIVLITANAHEKQLVIKRERKERPRREEVFSILTSNILQPPFSKEDFGQNFPQTLAKAIIAKLDSAVRNAGKGLKFCPIFNYYYKDGAPMITVGGMIATSEDIAKYHGLNLKARHIHVPGNEQVVIDVPHLTAKEKMRLDEFCPNKVIPCASELGFELGEDELRGYQKFYRYYPLFSELYI